MSTTTSARTRSNNPVALDREANSVIKRYALFGTGAGLIPVIGLDVLGVAAARVRMIQEIADIYNVPFNLEKVAIVATVSSALPRLLTESLKAVLGEDHMLGGFTDNLARAALSGFFTAEMGEVYKLHFQNGGTIDDIGMQDYLNYLSEQINSGKFDPSMIVDPSRRFQYLYGR